MEQANSAPAGSPRAFLTDPGCLLVVLGVVLGVARGFQKTAKAWPEWIYWKQIATQPWESVVGPDRFIFGYLPGFALFVKPFFALPSPFGALLFAVVNAASCVGILLLLRAGIWKGSQRLHLALAAMTAITMYLSVQNNQVVAPSLFLTLLAYVLMMRNAWLGSVALAGAILIKTIPATFLLLFTLIRRFRLAFLAGVIMLGVSVTASIMFEGVDVAMRAHAGFVEQVSAQDPGRVLTEGVTRRANSDNKSLSAAIVKLAPWIGNTPALILMRSMCWGTLILASYLSFFGIRRGCRSISILALWLSWTIVAAPFGRYYYLLFLLPACWLFWPKGPPSRHALPVQAGLWSLALIPLASRSLDGFPYTLLTVMAFGWCAYNCNRELGANGEQL